MLNSNIQNATLLIKSKIDDISAKQNIQTLALIGPLENKASKSCSMFEFASSDFKLFFIQI